MKLEVADPAAVPDADLLALYELEGELHREATPGDPRPSAGRYIAYQRAERGEHHRALVLARSEGGLAGAGWIHWPRGDTNRHLARVYLEVPAGLRRRRIGSALLARAAAFAEADGRTLLQGWTSSRLPSGDEFCRAVGAKLGLVSRESRLSLDRVDRGLLRRWLEEPHPGYELVFAEIPTSPELLGPTAEIIEVMNTAPRDDLDEEDFKVTPEMVAQGERALIAGGHRMWRYYARQEATGSIVGYTAVGWNAADAGLLHQGDTAVRPEHRGRKLGRWLKAAMLQKLLSEVPEAKAVVTGNATSNAAMLAINRALGFEEVAVESVWQVETATALGYTSRQSARPLE